MGKVTKKLVIAWRKWFAANVASILAVAAFFSSIATYFAISDNSNPAEPHTTLILGLLSINIIFLLALAVVIANKITSLWLARKRGSVGSRLQARIVIMFSLVSIIPTGIVAVFSIFYSIFVIQGWFSDRVGTVLEESVKVAEGYVDEHRDRIRADALTIANYLNSQYQRFSADPKNFARDVSTQARLLALNEAMVFRKSDYDSFGSNDVIARTQLSFSLENQIQFLKEKRPDLLEKADEGDVVTYISPHVSELGSDKILSLLRLYRFNDAYLLVGRFVDKKVLAHMENSKGAVYEYSLIKQRLTSQQVQFGIVFVIVALLLLFAALWVGISFAGELVNPIVDLIRGTERVKAGDLDTRVKEGPEDDEIATLNRAFNRMTEQLQRHNREMMDVNQIIDSRRRFTEDVLSGVTAGIIALDSKKTITLYNKTAPNLLSVTKKQLQGKNISEIFPEAIRLLEEVIYSPQTMLQEEISIVRNNRRSALLVRVVREEFSDKLEGFIVTFDDITELQSAQRSAAWADVARRIAHEIKNPLTPIHLSTERLKKKYGKDLKGEDAELFYRYLDTISRHVGNIGNIVEEFVSFARMPSPSLKQVNLIDLVREALLSQETAHDAIEFMFHAPKEDKKYVPILVNGDAGQISQVLTNVLKNSAEALEEKDGGDKKIEITISESDYINVEITDNGTGFPEDIISRVTEPYVTTKARGTGLGMAIVSKVMSDHYGRVKISNLRNKSEQIIGAHVLLQFPKVE